MQRDRAHVHRGRFYHFIHLFGVVHGLQQRDKEHHARFSGGVAILGIFGHAHNFVVAGVADVGFAKMLPNGISVGKELGNE